MKKIIRGIISMLLAVCLLVFLLAGCGADEGGGSGTVEIVGTSDQN
ncbi:MAG: hypothetical protein HWN68_11950 [Desulfobacterales bacterium]|nr:hypothetical protein [Desulfobacterales bacterium]